MADCTDIIGRQSILGCRLVKSWILVLLVILSGLFFGSSERAIDKIQEARVAETAREMVVANDWIVPHYNGELRLQKPPLTYWTTALSYKVFGINEFATRIPSAIFTLATAFLLFLWMKRQANVSVASNAVLLLTSTFIGMRYFRSGEADATLMFFICFACFAGFYLVETHQKFMAWLFMLGLGLGFLAKGPAGVAIPLIAVLIYAKNHSKLDRLKLLLHPISLLIFAVTAFAWYAWILIDLPNVATAFFSHQVDETFVTGTHKQPFYWYLLHAFDFFAPWSLLFIPAAIWFKKNKQFPPVIAFAFGWLAVVFILLTLTVNKQTQYALLLLPPLVILLSYYLEYAAGLFKRINNALFVVLLALMLLLISFVSYRSGIGELMRMPEAIIWLGLLIFICFCAWTNNPHSFAKHILGAFIVMNFMYLFSEQYVTTDAGKSDIKVLMSGVSNYDNVYQVYPGHGAVSFYAKEVIKTLSEKEMQSMIDSKAEFYLVAKSKSKFNAEAQPLMETEVGDWALWHFRVPAR